MYQNTYLSNLARYIQPFTLTEYQNEFMYTPTRKCAIFPSHSSPDDTLLDLPDERADSESFSSQSRDRTLSSLEIKIYPPPLNRLLRLAYTSLYHNRVSRQFYTFLYIYTCHLVYDLIEIWREVEDTITMMDIYTRI